MAYHGDTTRPGWFARKINMSRFAVENPITWRDCLRNQMLLILQLVIAYVMVFLAGFFMFTVRWFGYNPPRPHDWSKITELALFGANISILGVLMIFSPLIYQSCRWWYCKIRGIPYIPPKDRSKKKWVIVRGFDPRTGASNEVKPSEKIELLDK